MLIRLKNGSLTMANLAKPGMGLYTIPNPVDPWGSLYV